MWRKCGGQEVSRFEFSFNFTFKCSHVLTLDSKSYRWRERNQQDATNLMLIIKLLSQRVSGIIMPIIRRTRVHCRIWCSALVVMAVVVWSWDASCVHCEDYAAVHTLVLLMVGIMMSETCWDKSLIINIRLVASCWFLSLHPTFMMHGHKSLKLTYTWSRCPVWIRCECT